jgi:uncharacterized coiled-coil protein SlyX
MNFDERLERLEMELAHQQRMTDNLNDAVSQQSLDIMRMHRTIERLAKQLEEMVINTESDEPLRDIADEKPPHY